MWKMAVTDKIVLSLSVVLALLLSIGGCVDKTPPRKNGRELQSAVSHDETLRAVLWMPEQSGPFGATVSDLYQVWLESFPSATNQLLVLEADKTAGMQLSWTKMDQLEICYSDAQILNFRNRYATLDSNSLDVHKTEIVLRRVDALSNCGVSTEATGNSIQ